MVEMWRAHNGCTETDTYLHEVNWERHVAKRPEIEGLEEVVRETVERPDFAVRDAHGAIYKYRRGLGSGRTRVLRLVVLEGEDEQGAHFVKTSYFTKDIAEGTLLCGSVSMEA